MREYYVDYDGFSCCYATLKEAEQAAEKAALSSGIDGEFDLFSVYIKGVVSSFQARIISEKVVSDNE